LGALLHQDQKNEEALGHFERRAALAVGRSRCALSDRLGAFAQGNIDRAQMELEQLVKDSPEFSEARVTLATITDSSTKRTENANGPNVPALWHSNPKPVTEHQ